MTIQCKKLIEGIKDSERRFGELEQKTKSFATVYGHIKDAYETDIARIKDLHPNHHEKKIQKDIREALTHCERDIRGYKDKVSSLLKHREAGKFGIYKALNAWRDKVAAPAFDAFEKSIASHETKLQLLINIHHG